MSCCYEIPCAKNIFAMPCEDCTASDCPPENDDEATTEPELCASCHEDEAMTRCSTVNDDDEKCGVPLCASKRCVAKHRRICHAVADREAAAEARRI